MVNLCAVALITLYLAQHRRSYVLVAYIVNASPHLCSFLYFENIVQANACLYLCSFAYFLRCGWFPLAFSSIFYSFTHNYFDFYHDTPMEVSGQLSEIDSLLLP